MSNEMCSACAGCAASSACSQISQCESQQPITFSALETYIPEAAPQTARCEEMLAVLIDSPGNLPKTLDTLAPESIEDIQRQIAETRFTARFGERLLVKLVDDQLPRYVLLVGLSGLPTGAFSSSNHELAGYSQRAFCAIFGLMVESASKHEVTRLFISFEGMSARKVDVMGAAALLRCRCIQAAGTSQIYLPEIVVLCSPGEKPRVDVGLGLTRQLCPECPEPRMSGDTP